METNPSPFIPSGTGNISPMQAEWRGLSPNAPVEVLGEGVVVENNSMEELGLGQRLKSTAFPALPFASRGCGHRWAGGGCWEKKEWRRKAGKVVS